MHPEVNEPVYEKAGLEDLEHVARNLIKEAADVKVWLFHGEMGSGKTTLIKVVCNALGVNDAMSSPTFAIVNEYLTDADEKIFHFDFYRIKNEKEAFAIGTEEYFYSGQYCFVEWPEKIPKLLPDRYAEVRITVEDQTHRTIAISVHDGKKENRI